MEMSFELSRQTWNISWYGFLGLMDKQNKIKDKMEKKYFFCTILDKLHILELI